MIYLDREKKCSDVRQKQVKNISTAKSVANLGQRDLRRPIGFTIDK